MRPCFAYLQLVIAFASALLLVAPTGAVAEQQTAKLRGRGFSLTISPKRPDTTTLLTFTAGRLTRYRGKVLVVWNIAGRTMRGNPVQRRLKHAGTYTISARLMQKVRGRTGRILDSRAISLKVRRAPKGTPTAAPTVPPTSTSISVPTATPTPTSTPTPPGGIYSCSTTLDLEEDFTSQPPEIYGAGSSVQWTSGLGLQPNSIASAHPIIQQSTVFQLNFDNTSDVTEEGALGINADCSTCPVSSAGGRIGAAASFNGSAGLITGAQLDRYTFADTDFTWSAWFNTSQSGTQSIIGSYCGYGHLESHLRLFSGQLEFYVDPAAVASSTLSTSGAALTDGQWHHVAAVRHAANGSLELYLDGALNASVTGTAMGGAINCGRFAVGMSSISFPAGTGFNGLLDGIAVYDRALSSSEIAHLATGTRSSGEFTSREIFLSQPLYNIQAVSDESSSGRTQLEVSFDGAHWCPVNGELSDPLCSYPSSSFRYRAKILDETTLASVQVGLNCSPRCIDYDGDGYTAVSSTAAFCAQSEIDCDDQAPFRSPGMASSSCNCGATAPQVEACGDTLDNDCDGAIDADDNDCYGGGTIYYISSSMGNDANTGTDPLHPWKSVALAQSALNSLVAPGDKILFRRGDTWENETLSISTAASAAHPLTIGTYGFGERAHFHYTAAHTAITVSGASYVTLAGFHLTRSARTVNAVGILFDPQDISDNVTLRDIHIDGLAYGMLVHATNFVLTDSILNDNENELSGSGHSQGMWVYSGSDNGIVRDSIFRNNGKFHNIFDHNIYLGGGNNWLFENNDFSGDSGTSIVFHGIQEGHILRENAFHDCTANPAIDVSDYTTGQLLQNFLIERNRIFNNTGGAFWIRGAVNLIVQNNLFYNNNGIFAVGAGFDHETTMLTRHNTFYSNGGSSFAADGTYTFENNLYTNTTSLGGGLSLANPLFVDAPNGNFQLQSGSAAIDTASASAVVNDFFGESRPVDGDTNGSAVPDYGAVEYRP